MDPYVYISTRKSKDVRRQAPDGVRVAIHYPELGRTLELRTDANGCFVVEDLPAPQSDGDRATLLKGRLLDSGPAFTDRIELMYVMRSLARRAVLAGVAEDADVIGDVAKWEIRGVS